MILEGNMGPTLGRRKKFGECALELGFMTPDQVRRISSRQEISSQQMGHLCIQEGYLNTEQVARIVAMQHGLPYAENAEPDPELMDRIPTEVMIRHRFLPLAQRDKELCLAVSRPRDLIRHMDELEILLAAAVSPVIVSEDRIRDFVKELESRSTLDTFSDDLRSSAAQDAEEDRDLLSLENLAGEQSPTVRLVNSIILDAITKQASDIHIETSDAGILIRYRIDGMLYPATNPLDVQHRNAMISRIKVMAELDISEKRIPQDGRFKMRVKNRHIDFRVSILPTIFGEDAVIRILDRESLGSDESGFGLDDMGLPDAELRRMRRMIRAPYGMFLMTGPTGSGKTTTLYRALSEVRSRDVKIITIEDPVEYQLKGIVQIPVNEKKGLTFARGLRSILRHDPDKILVGEIRDPETAQIAIQSALTGHLVFTTVHANCSFEVLNRFTYMGIEAFDLITALNCIAAQRLIRTLCECRQPAGISERELAASGLDPKIYGTCSFYRPAGCEICKGTGFRGRKAIMELLEMDDDIREMFVRRSPASSLKKKAEAAGTVFLRTAALREVLRGESTLDEANRITFAEELENFQTDT